MILQALTELYEDLHEQGKIRGPGWGNGKVSFALYIDDEGNLIQLASLMEVPEGGKKLLPRTMVVPAAIKRSSGVAANFLCDNSSYLLGIDGKGKPDRTRDCFLAAKELHTSILKDVNSPAACALKQFFKKWNPAPGL